MMIERSSEWAEGVTNRLENLEPWQNWTLYKMSYKIAKTNLITELTGLQSPKYLPSLNPLESSIESG